MSVSPISKVEPNSPAKKAGILVGDKLISIGDKPILDVLDYKFYAYDVSLDLLVENSQGITRKIHIIKNEGEDLGLEFETYLMDKPRPCANNCVFCFVDQLPPKMRDTLYFKDDDARLSFLLGNYITLTNLSKREIERIVDLHISPINISVHATDPELRKELLGSKRGGECLEIMTRFGAAGITMNCQIVSCPGLNDGAALSRSMTDLAALYPQVNSVSIVPVGVTKWRDGLYPLRPYTKAEAEVEIAQVETFAKECFEKHGSSIFWCSDEFYLRAERKLPEDDYYEDYSQLENGVGMLRLLETEFHGASLGVENLPEIPPFSIATGVSAAPFLREIIDRAALNCHTKLNYAVYAIVNKFFGETIDVAGLITGGDLIAQLKDKKLGERLLISKTMVKQDENVFLDDVTVEDVEKALGVPVVLVEQDGFALYEAVFGV